VAAPAGRHPPWQSRATADATAVGRKRSRGFGHSLHGYDSGRCGKDSGGSCGGARRFGRCQPVRGVRHPWRPAGPAAAARRAVMAAAPPPPPRQRPASATDTTGASPAATAAYTAAAAVAAAAYRCVQASVVRAVVDGPPMGRRQARRQRCERRWPPPSPAARG